MTTSTRGVRPAMAKVPAALAAPKVQAALLRRERARLWLAIGQLALGVVLTFALPVVLSWGWDVELWMYGLGDFQVVVLVSGILMAVAYVIEYRTRGEWLVNQLRDIGPTTGMTWGTDRFWADGAFAWTFLMEVYLWVPRMVFEGVDKLRSIRAVGGVDRGRAAEMIGDLHARGQGLGLAALQHQGDDAARLSRTVAYLAFYEWIGASEDGTRAWLSSEGKEALGVGAGRG